MSQGAEHGGPEYPLHGRVEKYLDLLAFGNRFEF